MYPYPPLTPQNKSTTQEDILASPATSVLRCTQCLCTMKVNTQTIESAVDQMSFAVKQATRLPPPTASFVLVPPSSLNNTTTPNPTDHQQPDSTSSLPSNISPVTLEQLHMLMTQISNAASQNDATVPTIRYPLCTACGHALESLLIRHQTELEEEILHFQTLITDLEQNVDTIDAHREIHALEEEEQNLLVQLASLELEEQRLDVLDSQFANDAHDAHVREQAFYLNVNQFQATLKQFYEERESLNKRVALASTHLDQLRSTNVVNDVFRIGYDGQFATIDGFRFGKIPSDNRDWHEVNAGWGQACLMLHTLASRLKFEFQGYRLLPMGSTSKIQKLSMNNPESSDTSTNASSTTSSSVFTTTMTSSSPSLTPNTPNTTTRQDSTLLTVLTTYDLHGSSDLTTTLTRLLLTSSAFDKGLVAFLACVAQIGIYCQSLDPSFGVPYKIADGCIGGVPIRMHKGSRMTCEKWARACKYVLTNLKWIMAFATKHVSAKASNDQNNILCV